MNALLQETSSWTDTVDLALCLFIYEVCNDYQFDFLPGSDFVNFLNLKPASRAVTRAPEREPARLLHGVLRLADHQTTGTWKTLGGRVPETLRHIQVVLRQTPQRRLRQRCHKGESELPQGHRQGH